MTREEVDQYCMERELPAVFLDGLDHAIVGIHWTEDHAEIQVVYDVNKILDGYIKKDGMDPDGAREYYEFNVVRTIPYISNCAPPILMETIL